MITEKNAHEQIAERSAEVESADASVIVEGSPAYLAMREGEPLAPSADTARAMERHAMARKGELPLLEPEQGDLDSIGWPCVVTRADGAIVACYEHERGSRTSLPLVPLMDAMTGELPSTIEQARWLLKQRIAECANRRDATNAHLDHVAHVIIGPTSLAGLSKPARVVGAMGAPLGAEEHARAFGDDPLLDDGNAERHARIVVYALVVVVERGTAFVEASGKRTELSP